MQISINEFHKELKEHGNLQFPFLVSHEKLSKYDSNTFFWHWHPEIEITLIKEGQMIYEINNQTFHLNKGEALFGNTGVLHTGRMFENKECEYISITFDPKLIYGYENSIFYLKYVSPIIRDFSFFAMHYDLREDWHKGAIEILKDIVTINELKYDTYEFDIQSKLLAFWKVLFLNHPSTPTIASYDRRNYERIQEIISYIEQNYNKKITLGDIADHIHICRGECCKIFKKYMKIPLFKFIQEYRIEKSMNALINTNLSIGDIADKVGFSDSNYYSHTFLKVKGCSPTKYRNNNARRE